MKKPPAVPSHREIFARNLQLVRKLRGLSQTTLSEEAGMSRTYVSEVERMLRNIAIDNMGRLADTLGVPLADLVNPETFKGVLPARPKKSAAPRNKATRPRRG